MKGEAKKMGSDIQGNFTDEMFHFLFSSKVFQSLSEEEQRQFIQRYSSNAEFHGILQVAIGLSDVIEEVERIVPTLEDEMIQYFKKTRHSIMSRVAIEKNVYHYPFGKVMKEQGPLIVCLQQGESMRADSIFCKGMILPLFDVCFRDKRDLIILPFAEEFCELNFEYGVKFIKQFDQFIQCNQQGHAKIQPVIEKAKELFERAEVKTQAEIIIVSNLHLEDYDTEKLETIVNEMKSQGVAISCIAMNEQQFDEQPMNFLDKIYFVNE